MAYYFIRSEAGIGKLAQSDDPAVIEVLRAESLVAHPMDWHSPIYDVPDMVRESPIAIIFVDGYDRHLYADGSMENME
jgi:hypothetical protein